MRQKSASGNWVARRWRSVWRCWLVLRKVATDHLAKVINVASIDGLFRAPHLDAHRKTELLAASAPIGLRDVFWLGH